MMPDDPREANDYVLMPRPYEGASPMADALWTTLWVNCRNPVYLTLDDQRRTHPLVPISPRIALSLRDKDVVWVHLCEPRILYKRLRQLYATMVYRQKREIINKKITEIKIDIYDNPTLSEAHSEKYKILMNGIYVKNFMEEVHFDFNYKVGWTKATWCKCNGCARYTLTDRQRAMITLQNLGRGIHHG